MKDLHSLRQKFDRLNELRLRQDHLARGVPVVGFVWRTLSRARNWGNIQAIQMDLLDELIGTVELLAAEQSDGPQRAPLPLAGSTVAPSTATSSTDALSTNVSGFHSPHYLRHNARRLEHLASLRIPLADETVLEVGAGIGDQSHYYLDRSCKVTITDARSENVAYLKRRYPLEDVRQLDVENASYIAGSPYDVIHCYGLLYHTSQPEQVLQFLSANCRKLLFLETMVSFGNSREINLVQEDIDNPSQSYAGIGCRPTRPWLFEKLGGLFDYVYLPTTQPNHEEFPVDWTAPEKHQNIFSRAIFIASREKIENEILTTTLLDHQVRQA